MTARLQRNSEFGRRRSNGRSDQITATAAISEEEKMFTSTIWRTSGVLMVVAVPLVAGACASNSDVERAQATANQALQAAQAANQSAQRANATAQAASQTADAAMARADNIGAGNTAPARRASQQRPSSR